MTLTQDLINLRNQLVANHSDEAKATMNKANQELLNSNIIEQTLKVGEQAPNFTLPKELRSIYKEFGLDLPAHNGDDTFELPIAATYIIERTGKVVYCFVDPDYTKRLDPEIIVQTLSELALTA